MRAGCVWCPDLLSATPSQNPKWAARSPRSPISSPVRHGSAEDRCARSHGQKDAIRFYAFSEFAMIPRVAASTRLACSTPSTTLFCCNGGGRDYFLMSIVRSDGRPLSPNAEVIGVQTPGFGEVAKIVLIRSGSRCPGLHLPAFYGHLPFRTLVTGVSCVHMKHLQISGPWSIFSLNGFHTPKGVRFPFEQDQSMGWRSWPCCGIQRLPPGSAALPWPRLGTPSRGGRLSRRPPVFCCGNFKSALLAPRGVH